jgi:hypothetical protein
MSTNQTVLNLPAHYNQKKYPLYELIGAAIIFILLIIQLTKRYIFFDWLMDTVWIISGAYLVWFEMTKEKRSSNLPAWLTSNTTALLCSLFLFFLHFLIFLTTLSYGGFQLIFHIGAAVLYGLAFYLRSREQGFNLKDFQWKNLVKYPHWPMTVALAICTLGMFLPMAKVSSFTPNWGLQFGYNYDTGWGLNTWGYNYYSNEISVKGHSARFGRLICISFFFMLIFHIVKAAGNRYYPKHDVFFKIALPIIIAWWLLAAKGYNSLASFGNIIFILGMIALVFVVYFPQKVADVVKQKDLIK